MGNENAVYLGFDENPSDTFVATVGGMRRIDAGERVVARFPSDAVHLFDATSGTALHNRSLVDAEDVEPRV
jgi:multiple sugar transport system ATP-binding protein